MATLKEVAQVAVEARRDKGSGSGRRLREIERILRQHRVLSGLTPEKATSLLEDLGPTFVKMGQIAANRSDVIPPAYADAFKRLRADVPPMPFSTVLATIEESLGHPWRETFSCIGVHRPSAPGAHRAACGWRFGSEHRRRGGPVACRRSEGGVVRGHQGASTARGGADDAGSRAHPPGGCARRAHPCNRRHQAVAGRPGHRAGAHDAPGA